MTDELITPDILESMLKKTGVQIAGYNPNQVLFDHRKSHIKVNPLEMLRVVRQLKRHGLPINVRLAIVYKYEEEVYKYAESIINSYVNPRVRFFDSYGAALKWLVIPHKV